MKKNKVNRPPFRKDFYRISKERLEAYLDKLGEASDLIKDLRPKNDKGKVDWEVVDNAWGKIIDVMNSLNGFKNYEDVEAGGEIIQDSYLYEWTEIDNYKFYRIEFSLKNEDKNETEGRENKNTKNEKKT